MFEWVDRLLGRQNGMQISEAHWRAVEADLPFLQYLSADARLRLRAMALDFLQQKVFSGAQGFEPNNHVRLSIALQACLPVLELGLAGSASSCIRRHS